MLTIEKMIAHMMDPSKDSLILSDTCMDCDEALKDMLEHKITRLFTSRQKKTGMMQKQAELLELLTKLKQQQLSFADFSGQLVSYIYQKKRQYAQYDPSDFIVMMIVYEEQRYLLGLDNSYSKGYTHKLYQVGDAVEITIEQCPTLSASLVKKDAAFLICLSDFEVSTIETKVEIEGTKRCFYNDIIFHADAPASYHDAIQTINRVCDDLIREYELPPVDVKGKMKQVIKEHVEQEQPLVPDQIAEAVFDARPLVQKRFSEQLKDRGIEKAVSIENVKQNKAERVQRIKTDKGIELIIPIDYMKTTEYVEIVNEDEGTISIRLKNINRIISK